MPALDGLRFFAALFVLTHHWIGQGSGAWETPTPKLFAAVHPVAAYGWLGVQLFFLISGFVICMTSWDRSVGEFFASRVARLYPAYWFGVLAVTLVFLIWPVMYHPLSVREVLVNLTMLQDPLRVPNAEAVYWTLAIELRFYVLFALCVVWRGVTYRRAVLFCVLWTAASLVAPAFGIPGLTYLLAPEFSMYFIAGIAMYLMRRFRPTLLLWGIVGMSWILAQQSIVTKVNQQSGFDARPLQWSTATLIVSAFFAVMLLIALRWDGWVRWRGLTELGKLTYPLYLLHSRIGWTFIRLLHRKVPAWALLTGLLAVFMAISWLVERQIERPWGQVLRRRLLAALGEARQGSKPELARSSQPEAEPARGLAG